MNQKLNHQHIAASILIPALLTACGSGSESSDNVDYPALTNQPRAVEAEDWRPSQSLQARIDDSGFNIEDTGETLKFSFDLPDYLFGQNIQIYLNTDNDRQSGFGFENQAWGEIGADYIIENGYLFKSLSNDASWSWDTSAGLVESYSRNDTTVNMEIDKQDIGSPCSTIDVGVMSRSSEWAIETMYPVASTLSVFTINPCEGDTDTTPPVITLNGSSSVTVDLDSIYVDAGATASDDTDGDISSLISVTSDTAEEYDTPSFLVDTTIEDTYEIRYSVSDAAGNTTSATRSVIVSSEIDAITIDGQIGEWDYIDSQVTRVNFGEEFLFTKDDEYLYIGFGFRYYDNAPNFQIFLDTDDEKSTGYQVWDATTSSVQVGADYIIETGNLGMYVGPMGYSWSWEDQPSQIEYARGPSWAEMKIPLSLIQNEDVVMSIYKIDAGWSNYSLLKRNFRYQVQSAPE